ncbi:transcription factor IBH1 [Carica papaya]|uniref:transcription factor IBH1 n=1 Tax=Carica papaya TaxID=3649 RepID=UPI000B8C8160|nr:transcription factor IBH1 [Carica papaya]XP_021907123.1 transcription factor IBH1 [Carica papaya]
MNHHRPSLKSRFTRRFLPALIEITKQPLTSIASSSSPNQLFRRYNRVKIAADKSMVRAVGSKRAWTRALLFKIRNQARRRGLARRIRSQSLMIKRSTSIIASTTCGKDEKKEEDDDRVEQVEELRKLVPGGEAMDLCRLLGETAHYIKCLNTQVQE